MKFFLCLIHDYEVLFVQAPQYPTPFSAFLVPFPWYYLASSYCFLIEPFHYFQADLKSHPWMLLSCLRSFNQYLTSCTLGKSPDALWWLRNLSLSHQWLPLYWTHAYLFLQTLRILKFSWICSVVYLTRNVLSHLCLAWTWSHHLPFHPVS